MNNTITGNLTVKAGDGADSFFADGDNFTVSGNLTIQHGAGGSSVGLEADESNVVEGLLTIQSGAGDDDVTFGAAGLGDLEVGQTAISTGNGASTITFNTVDATVSGSLSISNADGDDTFDVNGTSFTVNGPASLVNGAGDSNTTFGAIGLTIAGKLAVSNAAGADELAFGGFITSLKSVVVANGNGASSITFSSVFGTTIAGHCKVTNGQGEDTFEVDGPTWGVTGNVTISDSHGGSTVHIDAGTGAGFDNTIGGNLTISGGDRSDDIDLYRIKVSGATSILTGDSNDFFDFIAIANAELVGAVLINSGGGTDFISLEQLNDGISTLFKSNVTINAGSGDDHLTIGFDAGDFVDFDLAALFEGGAGLDTLAGVGPGNVNTFPAGSPILSGWEASS